MLTIVEYSGPFFPDKENIETLMRALESAHFKGPLKFVYTGGKRNISKSESTALETHNKDSLLRLMESTTRNGMPILRIRANGFPVAPGWIRRFIESWKLSPKDYYHTDGDEFGLYNLTMEVITEKAIARALSSSNPFLPDGTLNAFIGDSWGVYYFHREDMMDYYRGFYDRLYSSPRGINLEVSTVCNLRCEMCCFHSDNYHAFEGADPKPFLSFKDFLTILDNIEVGSSPMPLDLTSRGEPLMNREIVKMVKEASRREFEVNIVTNGTLMDNTMSQGLIDAGLSSLFFSVDASTPETYKKIRRRADYEIVKRNIDGFLKRRTNGLKVGLKYVLLKENQQETNGFLSQWLPDVDWIVIARQIEPKDPMDTAPQFARAFGDWDGYQPVPTKYPCRYFWCGTFTSTRGKVLCCSMDQSERYPLGSLKSQTMSQIWGSSKLQSIRDKQLEGDFSDISICSNCSKDLSSCVTLRKGIEDNYFYKTTSSYKIYRELS